MSLFCEKENCEYGIILFMEIIETQKSVLSRFLFSDTRFAWVWLLLRVYMGYEWFMAGWGKLGSDVWTGSGAGTAVKGFLMGALQKTVGAHPDVSGWYAYFIEYVAVPNSALFSYLVVYGEIVVGLALILGLFTGVSAFLGAFMNVNYLFAGTVSVNPLMLVVQVFLMCAWKTAGWLGLDRYFLRKSLSQR